MNLETLKRQGFLVGIVGLAVIVLILVANPFITVKAGERGVLMNFGKVQDNVLEQGLHFIVPIQERVQIIDVRIQKSETNSSASSRDLQIVRSTVALNYHIIPGDANIVFDQIGLEEQLKLRIIDPAVQEVVKAISARYTAEELITKRQEVSVSMRNNLNDRLLRNHISVDDFSIVNFQFSQAYQDEVEAKQVAEQRLQKSALELQRIEIEKEQTITRAQAEAESLRLQREEITPELIELRRIEASIKGIEKWNGILPQVTGDSVPFIDVRQFKQQ